MTDTLPTEDGLEAPRAEGLDHVKRALVGTPMPSHAMEETLLRKTLALPIFASDALSSVAYATEAALIVLIGVSATSAYLILPVSAAVSLLLAIVVLSYRQTVRAYSTSGGSYIVSRENLGTIPSLIAGAALLTDYVLTVAVSVAAGVLAIVSAVPSLQHLTLELAIGSRRPDHRREPARRAGVRCCVRDPDLRLRPRPPRPDPHRHHALHARHLSDRRRPRAVACGSGCDHAVRPAPRICLRVERPNGCGSDLERGRRLPAPPGEERGPDTRHSRRRRDHILHGRLLAGVPDARAPLGQRSRSSLRSHAATFPVGSTFGFMFWVVQITTFAILILAANTSFQGFPRLAAMLARDRFFPRQFGNLGDRLVYSNGIIVLSGLAVVLLWAYDANVDSLIHLYVIGVFTAFTLSQAGMVRYWRRTGGSGWKRSATVNAVGATATGVVLVVVVLTKFTEGAWLVIVAIPLLVLAFLGIHRHYRRTARRLRAAQPRSPPPRRQRR